MTESDRPDADDEAIKDLNYAADELGISFENAMRRAAALQALILTLENEDLRVVLLSPDEEEFLPIERHPLYLDMIDAFGPQGDPVQILPSFEIDKADIDDQPDSAGNVIPFPGKC